LVCEEEMKGMREGFYKDLKERDPVEKRIREVRRLED
jgi:hypothetical protein